MKKTQGIYTLEDPNYSLEIEYQYFWDDGDYEQPPEASLEIDKVYLSTDDKTSDITDFYYDFLDDSIGNLVWEYAEENKYN